VSNSLQFDDPGLPSGGSRVVHHAARKTGGAGPSWLSQFTATLAGVVLGGAILVFGIRTYIRWSIADTMSQVDERIQKDLAPKR